MIVVVIDGSGSCYMSDDYIVVIVVAGDNGDVVRGGSGDCYMSGDNSGDMW